MTKRTNDTWLNELQDGNSAQDAALADLRVIVIGGLQHALVTWLPPTHPNFNMLVEDAAQETLLRVTKHLDDFEQRSQFTTWVHKIAVRVALTELRRQRWKDRSLDELTEYQDNPDALPVMKDPTPGPLHLVERADMLMYLMNVMQTELTPRQRVAMTAVALKGIPLEEVARRLGTERNALYKLLHDARLKLKNRLLKDGLSLSDALTSYEVR